MQVKPDQYIFPPRAADAIPRGDTEFLAQMGWIAQLKYNDSRCIIKMCANGHIELWNRHAEKFRSYNAPQILLEQLKELRHKLGLDDDKVSMLDGGLLDQKHHAIKDTLVIWDILVKNDKYLTSTPYSWRYDELLPHANLKHGEGPYKSMIGWMYEHLSEEPTNFGPRFTPDIFMPYNWSKNLWDTMWDTINKVNAPFTIGKPGSPDYEIKPLLEGLVFKDPSGQLEIAFSPKNNESWMMRSRVQTGRHMF